MTNDGDAALTITGIRTGTSEFLVGPTQLSVRRRAGSGVKLHVRRRRTPANLGPRSDEVTIETSDGPYRIPLRANGVAAALPAASNFDGLWWSSPAGSESGWGINFAHQGDVIFVTWFTYDLDGKAWWLTMTATKTAEEVYRGTIYQTRGPGIQRHAVSPRRRHRDPRRDRDADLHRRRQRQLLVYRQRHQSGQAHHPAGVRAIRPIVSSARRRT